MPYQYMGEQENGHDVGIFHIVLVKEARDRKCTKVSSWFGGVHTSKVCKNKIKYKIVVTKSVSCAFYKGNENTVVLLKKALCTDPRVE